MNMNCEKEEMELCGRRRSGSSGSSRVHFGFSTSHFLPIFVILVLCTLLSFSVQMSEAGYPEQFLESVEVCASQNLGILGSLSTKKIRLANFPNNTVSVKITRWEELYGSFYNFRCRFKVTAPKNMGVMVVIQQMSMRTTKRFTCRDYVKFEHDGAKTSQICGVIDRSDISKIPEKIIGPRKFYDQKGEMEVTFFSDERDKSSEEEEPISLHMIFTAYRECTPPLMNSNVVRQCSSVRSHSCISSHLFCDGVINCGFNEDDGFGADEQNCGGKSRDMDEVDRTISIYVFAITTVATLVIVVIFSLIVCCCLRKFSKQRRDHQIYAQAANSSLHHLHVVHSQHPGVAPDIIRLDTTGPSAPLRAPVEPSPEKCPVVDTDQPPPYDALFPSSKSSSAKPSKKQ